MAFTLCRIFRQDALVEWCGLPHEISSKRECLLWVASFLVALMVHSSVALIFYTDQDEGEVTSSASSSAVYYVTLPMPDAPAREIAAGQEQVQTDAAPPPTEAKPEPLKELEPIADPERLRPSETKLEESKEEKPAIKNPIPLKELPPTADAAVTLPTAVPPPPAKEVVEKKEELEEKSEAQPSPLVATASETTAPTSASVRSASDETWKSRLIAHLQRHKRYPGAAATRGEQGTVEITFSIDREGRLGSARILRGSGFALLDQETMAMVQRAQPMPRPPADVAGPQFFFTVLVKFMPR